MDGSEAEALPYNITELIKTALKEVYENNGGDLMNAALFEATYHNLLGAIDSGYGVVQFDQPDFEFVQKLRESARYFSARKTILQVIQLTALTADEANGTSRSFSEFKRLSKGIIGNYNVDWLQTEYTTALMAARSAREWQDFEADQDLFPNLEFMRTISANPRPEHLRYVGTIRPLHDPFWDTHLPPITWNCSCSVKNTDEPSTVIPENIDETDSVTGALQNNPAKTAQLFNIDRTRYGELTKEIPDAVIKQELNKNILPDMDFYVPVYRGVNGGLMEIHPAIDPVEYDENTRIGYRLAKNGDKVQLFKKDQREKVEGWKFPDAIVNGKRTEFKIAKSTDEPRKAIQNGFEDCNEIGTDGLRKAEICVFYVNRRDFNKNQIIRGLKPSIVNKDGSERNSHVKEVWFAYPNGEVIKIHRSEIINYDYLPKLRPDPE